MGKAEIPRIADAAVFLVEHSYAGVRLRQFLTQGKGSVGGAIVDQEQFQILVRRVQNVADCVFYMLLPVVDRDDNTESGIYSHESMVTSRII